MGLYDRDYYRDDSGVSAVRRHGPSAVAVIILLNVVLYLVDQATNDALFSKMELLGSTTSDPWQWYRCLTHGVAHDSHGFMHIFCNMLTLFFFGPVLERLYGKKEFLIFYLGSIIFGGITWNVLNFNSSASALGASGGITAVVILFACRFPKNIILIYGIIPFPAWLAGVLYVLYDAFCARHGMDNVAHDVHLAGAAFALFYFFSGIQFSKLFSAKRKSDPNSPSGYRKENDVPVEKVQPSVFRIGKSKAQKKSWDRESLEAEVDRILLKYNRMGKESLTKEEEETLQYASQEFQKWHK